MCQVLRLVLPLALHVYVLSVIQQPQYHWRSEGCPAQGAPRRGMGPRQLLERSAGEGVVLRAAARALLMLLCVDSVCTQDLRSGVSAVLLSEDMLQLPVWARDQAVVLASCGAFVVCGCVV
jgi:hypothetical protein